MAAKKRYKRKTNAEKKMDMEIREQLRKEGILPPIKPRLNRKRFAKEVMEAWQEQGDIYYLPRAFGCIIPSGEFETQISSEQIGALKVLKLALELKKFEEELVAKGETKYSVVDLYDQVVGPVLKL